MDFLGILALRFYELGSDGGGYNLNPVLWSSQAPYITENTTNLRTAHLMASCFQNQAGHCGHLLTIYQSDLFLVWLLQYTVSYQGQGPCFFIFPGTGNTLNKCLLN